MQEIRSLNLDGPVFDIIIPSSTAKNSRFLNQIESDGSSISLEASKPKNVLDEELYVVMGMHRDSDSNETACKLVVYDLHKQKVSWSERGFYNATDNTTFIYAKSRYVVKYAKLIVRGIICRQQVSRLMYRYMRMDMTGLLR
jgi:lipopolysaccharide export LptBFGC system permease protein LptF